MDANWVGESIARNFKQEFSFRRANEAIHCCYRLRVGAEKEIKVKPFKRSPLGGAEMARSEMYKEENSLHTLRADLIKQKLSRVKTVYGNHTESKFWIFKGEVYGKRELVS